MPSSEIRNVIFDAPAMRSENDERDLFDSDAGEVGELRGLDLEGVAGAEQLGERRDIPG